MLQILPCDRLIATNAARHRKVAGPSKTLLEFGLRRAQGPDGGMSATRYSFIGGFDGTSNAAGGHKFGIPVLGTHAHSLVTSYSSLSELKCRTLKVLQYCADLICLLRHASLIVWCAATQTPSGADVDFVSSCLKYREKLGFADDGCNEGELAAFIAYAQAFPKGFLALVDTYETLKVHTVSLLTCV